MKMNKIGGDKILSMYWFGVLVLVAGGIVLMANSFYVHPYDIREIETEILSNNLADCISEKGILVEGIFTQEFKDNFLENCDLKFKESEYYVEIGFYNLTDLDNRIFEISNGNSNYKADCSIEEDYSRFAKCNEKRMYSVYENKQYLIELTAIVGKIDENVK